MNDYKVTITFETEVRLTGIEVECIETQLIDEYLVENIKVTQDRIS